MFIKKPQEILKDDVWSKVITLSLVLFFILVWGGYDFLMSHGTAEKVKSAQAKITAGIIGFVLLMLSFLIVKLISFIFGLGSGII